jgi:hypothetical protein
MGGYAHSQDDVTGRLELIVDRRGQPALNPVPRAESSTAEPASHGAVISPLVDHPTVGKSADAVLAARAVADLALASALDAEH